MFFQTGVYLSLLLAIGSGSLASITIFTAVPSGQLTVEQPAVSLMSIGANVSSQILFDDFNYSNYPSNGSIAGWHTLVTQVSRGKVKYFIDGKPLAEHGGQYYPRSLMSINFNLWFIKDAAVKSSTVRHYQEDIDWVFHEAKKLLAPEEVEAKVTALRRRSVRFQDTVPAPVPALISPCDY
jgi:hypothetical protein